MPTPILDRISSPADLSDLSYSELDRLAAELRAEMVASTSVNGGHLAPSLGAVELIIALHRVLDCPADKIVFDVGHQAYAHKLLTGRREGFRSLRTSSGVSGFPKIDESPYDAHDSGHASDSLATALGYCLARDIDGRDETVAVLVGDASFAGGMSMEALNEIGQSGTRMIIVLNDNGMSISRSVGGLATFLGKARMSEHYTALRDHVEDAVNARGRIGRFFMDRGNRVKESFKQLILPGDTFFEGFGVTYVGPVDGHDILSLELILREAKEMDGPVLVHAVTTKGRGYAPAEAHPDLFHGIGPFDIHSGRVFKTPSSPSWTSVFSDELLKMADEHDDIVAITAAMPAGTGLEAFFERYPGRFVDAGIAEESAVTMASSMAMSGKVPFVAIYSTFMQRAYDQLMVNVALQRQHVVLCLDRAGLVGADGPTHHGSFDLSYMRTIPGMTILAPSDALELRAALRLAYRLDGPVCVRYPRGSAPADLGGQHGPWHLPHSVVRRRGSDVAVLAVGSMVEPALEAAALLEEEEGISAEVVDMRFVKPLDADRVRDAARCGTVVTVEENSVAGGFGSAVAELLAEEGVPARLVRLGLPDGFAGQGTQAELRAAASLDAAGIASVCREAAGR